MFAGAFLMLLVLWVPTIWAIAPARSGQPYAESICDTDANILFCEDFNWPTNITCTGDGGLVTWTNPANTQAGNQFQAPAGSCAGVTIPVATDFPAKTEGAMPSGGQADHVYRGNAAVDSRNGLWLFLRQNSGDNYVNGAAASTDWYTRFQVYFTSNWVWPGDPKTDYYDYSNGSPVDQKILFVYPPQVRNICNPTDCSYDAGPFTVGGNWDGTRRYADGLLFRVGSGGGTGYATFPNNYGGGGGIPAHAEYRPFQCQTNTAGCWRDPDDALTSGQLWRFNTNTWYTIEFRYRLSTVNTNNGTITLWINGTQLYHATDLATCTAGSETPDCSGLGAVYLSHYHNSGDPTNWNGSMVVDNLIVSTAPIGVPSASGGGEPMAPAAPANLRVVQP